MPASDGFLDMLRDLLAPAGAITIKRMFSGAGIYAGGVMFGLVADDVLYLKADAATTPRFAAEGLEPFTYEGKTKPVAMSYWRAPERLFDDPDEMTVWVRDAIAASQRSPVPAKRAAKAKAGDAAIRRAPRG